MSLFPYYDALRPEEDIRDRLTMQLQEKYYKSLDDAKAMAHDILLKRGHVDEKGNLTDEGKQRSLMGKEERAIDRRIKERGGNRGDYLYSPDTNRVVKNNGF